MERPLTRASPQRRRPARPRRLRASGRLRRCARRCVTAPADLRRWSRRRTCAAAAAAGFPTGHQVEAVPMGPISARVPSTSSCNADEMEPGTFKDRLLLEGNPHQLIEGMILAAYAIEADVAYIFLRWRIRAARRRRLRAAVAEAYGAATSASTSWARRSASSFTCTRARAAISAAKRRRCSTHSKASAPSRARSRPIRR